MDTSTLPTKNNLIKLQGKIRLSKQGQELLEKKKFILTMEKNKYEDKKEQLEQEMKMAMNYAYNKLKQASIDVGIEDLEEISNQIEEENTISIKYKSIMGVEIPSVIFDEKENKLQYGLYKTTVAVDECIIAFDDIKTKIIKLAEIENIIFRLNASIEKVQKRSNALKDIIIPEDEKTKNNIKNILEEREREEFTRMKVVKQKNSDNY